MLIYCWFTHTVSNHTPWSISVVQVLNLGTIAPTLTMKLLENLLKSYTLADLLWARVIGLVSWIRQVTKIWYEGMHC